MVNASWSISAEDLLIEALIKVQPEVGFITESVSKATKPRGSRQTVTGIRGHSDTPLANSDTGRPSNTAVDSAFCTIPHRVLCTD